MEAQVISWQKVADKEDDINWQPNNLAPVEFSGREITLARYNNQIFACAHKCPHAGGIMANGFLDATGNIVCPLHFYKFNLKNGRNITGEGYWLKAYPVEKREAGIFVGFQEK